MECSEKKYSMEWRIWRSVVVLLIAFIGVLLILTKPFGTGTLNEPVSVPSESKYTGERA